jgi:transposase
MKGMAMTIVETRAVITGGVDTHLEVNVAAALNAIGGLLGLESFATTPAGYAELTAWLASFGVVELVGVEGTGSYGAGLARHLEGVGVTVVEVNRPDRGSRRRDGKSDPLDAVSAARAAQSGRATASPKGRDGVVEAIRVVMVTKRSARRDRTATINQMRALVVTAPDAVRARFAHRTTLCLIETAVAQRPRGGDLVDYTTSVALRELGRRAVYLADEIDRLDTMLAPLVTARAPGLLAVAGVGVDTAALLLIAAGDHPERLASEAAWAHLCGVAPIPASSGKTTRHRLNPAGDRQANHALWRIVLVRMSHDPRTRAYVTRRSLEGKTKPEIMRCLKRYVARETYPLLAAAVAD